MSTRPTGFADAVGVPDLLEQLGVGHLAGQRQVDVGHRGVAQHPHHGGGHVEVGGCRLEVRAAGPLQPRVAAVDGRAHPGERSVRGDELGGRLVADALDARQPVAGVAAQHRHVEVGLTGGHGIPLVQVGLGRQVGVAHPALARVEHPDAVRVVDELEQVAVAGDDVDRHHAAVPLAERADDVVGLAARRADPRDADGAQRVADDRHLGGEVVGALLDHVGALDQPVGLVGGHQVDPPLRPPVVVPAGHEVRRPVRGDQRGDHVEEAAQRVGRCLVGAAALVGHAEEGAEVQRGGVQEHEAFRHAPTVAAGGDHAEVSSPAGRRTASALP